VYLQEAGTGRTLGERLGNWHWLGAGTALALLLNSELACLKGDWSKGRDLAEDALALASQDPLTLSKLAILEYETGNFSQGAAYLERLLEILALAPPSPRAAYFYPALAIPHVARVSGVSFRLSEAAEAARIILSASSNTPMSTVVARCGLGIQALIQGDAPAAAEQYVDLQIVRGILLPLHIAGDRVLGLLSQTMVNLDQSTSHFEDALAFCRKAGYRPELAWTCCDYADTLREREAEGDRAKAISLLDESLAISSELGMRPLMERVLSRREILGA
jgi:tetratricopeptide (TPR) repeat protein